VSLSIDLDAHLAEIDAVEFDASSSTDQYYPRRKFFVLGSSLFYRGLLIASHANREEQRLISMVYTVLPMTHNEICKLIKILSLKRKWCVKLY
jgi:hypothetical protein